jgi:hypothetical protein
MCEWIAGELGGSGISVLGCAAGAPSLVIVSLGCVAGGSSLFSDWFELMVPRGLSPPSDSG